MELAQRGAYLGYDGMARHRERPDSALIELIEAVCGQGMTDHLPGDPTTSADSVT